MYAYDLAGTPVVLCGFAFAGKPVAEFAIAVYTPAAVVEM